MILIKVIALDSRISALTKLATYHNNASYTCLGNNSFYQEIILFIMLQDFKRFDWRWCNFYGLSCIGDCMIRINSSAVVSP